MNIVDTGANLVSVSVVLEGLEQLHVALRRLDGNNVRIQALDGWENVVEVGVAEVRVGLGGVGDTGRGETEGINGPGEVMIPINTTKRQLKKGHYQLVARGGTDAVHVHPRGWRVHQLE